MCDINRNITPRKEGGLQAAHMLRRCTSMYVLQLKTKIERRGVISKLKEYEVSGDVNWPIPTRRLRASLEALLALNKLQTEGGIPLLKGNVPIKIR